MPVTFDDIVAARQRIREGVYLSPCPESIPLSELTGCRVFCKLDSLQRTGSFKERGARNALALLDDAKRKAGVIAASAGNHALALAYHGREMKVPVTVVMPRFAPLIKVATCRRLGATVHLHGDTFGEARAKANELAEQHGLTYVHGYDDPAIIAGQGTMGLEILEQVDDIDAVVVPVGGGGLIAGVSTAIKHERPDVQVIGVEAAAAPSYTASLAQGYATTVKTEPTLADGLAVGRLGELAFETARSHVDRILTVDEEKLALAILRLAELEKSVVEGAAAAPLAALLTDELAELQNKRVVLLICGGNIDPTLLGRVIEYGMVVDGRLCRFTAVISDRPGGLERLTRAIADAGASIRDIAHDRAFVGPNFWQVRVVCTVETNDREHIRHLLATLSEAGITVENEMHDAHPIRGGSATSRVAS
ncbi:MAG: threonine ammonia-lyase [Phycisphaeraceae bacterium]